jgi:hypothetical protein
MRLRTPHALLVGALLVALTGVSGGTAQAAPAATRQDGPVVVVRGLNSPRQLSVTPLGGLLVAEAGAGGNECFPLDANGDMQCVGKTGAISWVPFPQESRTAHPIRLVTGLLSFAAPGGLEAFGPAGVAATGGGKFLFVQPGFPPVPPPADVDTSGLQKLLLTRVPGAPRTVGDLGAFEAANDPDHQGPDSDPYSVLVLPDQVLVADAAGNDVVRWRDGKLSLFAVFPNLQDGGCAGQPNDNGTTGCDAVPTGLAVGPDGLVYVASLGGPPGTARVYVMDPNTGRIIRQITGLTGVSGLAVGPDGSVYASELFTAFGPNGPDFTTGKVTRIRPDGTRTDTTVPAPAGLAIIGHSLYVSAWTVAPAGGLPGQPDSGGQLWRLRI